MIISNPIKISIVIPCLNEANQLADCFACIPSEPYIEIIIVDGGSSDQTLSVAETLSHSRQVNHQDVTVLKSQPGRAKQMNYGAGYAKGRVLLFLHADTLLPQNAIHNLINFANQHEYQWGRFDVCLDDTLLIYRVIETFINERSAFFHIATGDQGIFVFTDTFKIVQGFPNIPLMEDVSLSQSLKKISQSFRLRSQVRTSARRWQNNGVVKTVLLMWALRFAYFIGVSPNYLHKIYYEK